MNATQIPTTQTCPAGVVDFVPDPELYPFESNWFESSVGAVHYLDEGEGQVLWLMHGNPDWSYLYRQMIPELSKHFRCIVPDLVGFGLSTHPDPQRFGAMPEDQSAVMRELVEHLDLSDMILMGQDWGGPIGMDIASHMPDRIAGLVMGNTWFWPSDIFRMKTFSRLSGTRLMQRLILRRNIFVTQAMKRSVQVPMTDADLRHYADVLPSPAHRRGVAVLPTAIRSAKPWLADLERRVATTLREKPLLFFFGEKDPVLGRPQFLSRWRKEFPAAQVVHLPGAGHFIQHDAPDEIVAAIIDAYAT